MNTENNNESLAKFLEWEKTIDGGYILPPTLADPIYKIDIRYILEFYSDWNWLMEVVEKIEATEVNNIRYIDFHIMPDAVIVSNQEDEQNPLILINKSECKGSIEKDFIMFETKIQAVYNACVEFVKWYSQQ